MLYMYIITMSIIRDTPYPSCFIVFNTGYIYSAMTRGLVRGEQAHSIIHQRHYA